MSRRTLERRRAARERWPNLANLLTCYFNQDYNLLYGSIGGAFAAAMAEAPLELRRTMLREWRDWQAVEGLNNEDLRRFVNDGFGVDLYFKKPLDARNFMNRVYDEMIASVRAETGRQGDAAP